jgi:hypothetical protein
MWGVLTICGVIYSVHERRWETWAMLALAIICVILEK